MFSWKKQLKRARQWRTGEIPRTESPIIFRSSSPPRHNQQIKASPRANLRALLFISLSSFFSFILSTSSSRSPSPDLFACRFAKKEVDCVDFRARTTKFKKGSKDHGGRKARERVKTFAGWPLSLRNWPHLNFLVLTFLSSSLFTMNFLSRVDS